MESQSYDFGVVASIDDKSCKIKVGDAVYELDRQHGPVLVPTDLKVGSKVKMIVVDKSIRHLELLAPEEEAKIAAEGKPPSKAPVKKLPKKIKADQFFSVYDKGFQQKVYMYKVGVTHAPKPSGPNPTP